ncbi:MAG: 16S rRNA (uracil(1498)-N(3))-methyltransferase [Gemmatimonas sp.]
MSSPGSSPGDRSSRGAGTADDAEREDATPAYRARTRLHVADPLRAGASVALAREAAHYIRDVLRMRAGDTLAVFNGRDGEWRASLAHLARNAATIEVADRLRAPAPEPDVWLLFALLKRTRTDLVVEKATELGVARILPVITTRTQASRVNGERLAAIAREAAEQCERLTVPEVAEPRRLADVLDAWPATRRLIVADEAGGGQPIAAALMSPDGFPSVTPNAWALLVGPEGGFDGAELDRLRKLPFVTPVALGPRILRAETAALAALACVQALAGDWRNGVRREPASS